MAHVTRIKAADKTSLANDKTTKTSSAEKSATAVKNKAKYYAKMATDYHDSVSSNL